MNITINPKLLVTIISTFFISLISISDKLMKLTFNLKFRTDQWGGYDMVLSAIEKRSR